MNRIRTMLSITAVLAASVTLAACSSTAGSMAGMDHSGAAMTSAPTSSSAPTVTGTNNAADVTFVTDMIPHHTQAVTMVDTIEQKSDIDPAVLTLAAQIKSEQQPEIEKMTSWLAAWGAPAATAAGMSGMDMGTGTGMMSDADMAALDSATGSAASTLFLSQMIQHHQGAIGMATTEIASGQDPEAIALAKSIVSSQTAEIQTMTTLLNTLQ